MSFFTDTCEKLRYNRRVTYEMAEMPVSYADQPHNFASKLRTRGGIPVKAIINQLNKTITLMRIDKL